MKLLLIYGESGAGCTTLVQNLIGRFTGWKYFNHEGLLGIYHQTTVLYVLGCHLKQPVQPLPNNPPAAFLSFLRELNRRYPDAVVVLEADAYTSRRTIPDLLAMSHGMHLDLELVLLEVSPEELATRVGDNRRLKSHLARVRRNRVLAVKESYPAMVTVLSNSTVEELEDNAVSLFHWILDARSLDAEPVETAVEPGTPDDDDLLDIDPGEP